MHNILLLPTKKLRLNVSDNVVQTNPYILKCKCSLNINIP